MDTTRRGSKNNSDGEESDGGDGMGVRFEAGVETGLRVEIDIGVSRERNGEDFGLPRSALVGEGGNTAEAGESIRPGGRGKTLSLIHI